MSKVVTKFPPEVLEGCRDMETSPAWEKKSMPASRAGGDVAGSQATSPVGQKRPTRKARDGPGCMGSVISGNPG